MRFFKGLFLFLVVFVLFILLILFQINFGIKNTILSSSYFTSVFNKNKMDTVVSDFLIATISQMAIGGDKTEDGKPRSKNGPQIPDIESMINKYLDKSWLENQLPVLIKGMHAYLVVDTDKLPILDIRPLKEILLEVMVGQVTANSGIEQNLKEVNKIVRVLNKQYKNLKESDINDAFINKIIKSKILGSLGSNKDIAEVILRKYVAKKGAEFTVDDANGLIKDLMVKTMKLDQVKDYLDLNLLLQIAYKNQDSPLAGIRIIIAAYKNIVFRTFVLVIILLLMIIVVVGFKPRSFMRWAAAGMFAGGAAGISIGILGMYMPFFVNLPDNIFASAKFGGQEGNYAGIQKWIESFISGYFKIIAIEGAILIFIGLVLVFTSSLIIAVKKDKSADTAGQEALLSASTGASAKNLSKGINALITISRILITLLLIYAIPMTVIKGVKDFTVQFEMFNAAINVSSGSSKNFDLMGALAEVTGAEFLKNMGGDSSTNKSKEKN